MNAASGRGAGRLYGPGLPPEGAERPFTASVNGLSVDPSGAPMLIPWSSITARDGNFHRDTTTLEWTSADGAWALVITDPVSGTAVAGHLSRPIRRSTADRRTRRISMATIGLLAGVPVLLLILLLTQADRLIGWAVDRIPVQTEIDLGREAAQQQAARLDLLERHPALPTLRALGARLTRGSKYPFEFHIARDTAVNAFAMPGGFVVFNSGLLEQADTAEEVAGVLAHEIQHVERRHGLRGLVHAAGLAVALRWLLGEAGGSMAASWAQNLGQLRFSRQQEAAADRGGVAALIDAGIDPRGMATFFRKLSREHAALPALLSSHPAGEERLAAVEALMPNDRRFEPLDGDWMRVRSEAQ
ncbi:MAG: M48 family metallopeptidase [Burkholderiales bacterium]|nr:M48 family metallopeptidase [Burkholderiales bacterium]